MTQPVIGTADICDSSPEGLGVLGTGWRPVGVPRCSGEVVTLRLHHGNHGLKQLLAEPGRGRVVVLENSGRYFSVVGDRVAGMALDNGWSGLFVHGYIRDSAQIAEMPLAVWALGTCPRKGPATPGSDRDVPLVFGDVVVRSGQMLYADDDGVIVTDSPVPDISF